jgi:serine/threonine protein kinase
MGAAAAPEPNLVLAGRYRLDARLGAGGMGAIWRAEHLILKAPVAIKLLERDAPPDEDTVARFLREAQAAASLRSPHVVQIIDYGVDGRWPFIVMELLEGETLAQRIKRKRRLSSEETVRILAHVARAMGKAHDAGIVHRDLKPENVFLVHNEEEEIAKVLDFGVAKVSSTALGAESTRTRTGSILGTPYYMSPEQAQGNKTVDHRSDLWALGVIAFECLTGTRPFYSDGLGDLVLAICVRDIPVPSSVAPVPLGFDAWFSRATARDANLRFQSAREMIDALRDALGIERDRGSDPDIVVSSAQPKDTAGSPVSTRTPNSRIPTVVATVPPTEELSPSFTTREQPVRHSSADGHAPTVLADIPELEGGALEANPAFRDLPPEPTRSPLVPVFGVALGALGVGLIAGFLILPDREPEPELPPVTPGLTPVRSVNPPKVKSAAPKKKEEPAPAPATSAATVPAKEKEREKNAAPPESAPAASAAAPPESPSAVPVNDPQATSTAPADPPKPVASESEAPSDPPPASSTYVKPDWAIPDENGPIRRSTPVEE